MYICAFAQSLEDMLAMYKQGEAISLLCMYHVSTIAESVHVNF